MELDTALKQRIDELVAGTPVVLFMKGSRRMPQCGFSARVVGILDGLLDEYETADVLEDADLREGIKAYSDWPTLPQLYVGGEFLGGCDIITEMAATGELHGALGIEVGAVEPPSMTITREAEQALDEALAGVDEDAGSLRFRILPGFQYELKLGPPMFGDVQVALGTRTVLLDRATASKADGTVVDYVAGRLGGGFRITNPAEPPPVQQIRPGELKRMIDAGATFRLIDVRSEPERAIASIGGELLDGAVQAELDGLDRETTLVFYCRTGARSQQASEHFRSMGFVDVRNLAGGIHAWSDQVDPGIAKY
jgi:monothiol glutaredoxin